MKNTCSIILVCFSVNVNLWLKDVIETESPHMLSVYTRYTVTKWPHLWDCNSDQETRHTTRRSPSRALSQPRPSGEPLSPLPTPGVLFPCFELCTNGIRQYNACIWLFSSMQRCYAFVLMTNFPHHCPIDKETINLPSATVCSLQNASSKDIYIRKKCIYMAVFYASACQEAHPVSNRGGTELQCSPLKAGRVQSFAVQPQPKIKGGRETKLGNSVLWTEAKS